MTGNSDQSRTPGNGAETSDVPDWEDEYVDRVSDRLMFNYDLSKDRRIDGERFTLFGELRVENAKQFFHPALSYGHHEAVEHLFVRRESSVSVADLERLVDLGHELADEWIDPSERHFSTDFTFVVVVPEIPQAVGEHVTNFGDRTLLKYGYHGHYEVNLVVVSPEETDCVASENADVRKAFVLWERNESTERPGLLGRLSGYLRS